MKAIAASIVVASGAYLMSSATKILTSDVSTILLLSGGALALAGVWLLMNVTKKDNCD